MRALFLCIRALRVRVCVRNRANERANEYACARLDRGGAEIEELCAIGRYTAAELLAHSAP